MPDSLRTDRHFLRDEPSQALLRQISPFVTYGDIFPRSGGSLSSRGRLLVVAAKFFIALETLVTRLAACALSVKAYGFARFPLLSLRDIFPRSGGSLSSKGEPRALPEASSLYLTL